MLPLLVEGTSGNLCLKPFLQVVYEKLFDTGFREFYFITGRAKRSIEDHFTIDNEFLRYLKARKNSSAVEELAAFYEKIERSSIIFVNQAEPRGFGDALHCAKSPIGKNSFLVHAGDDFIISRDNLYLKRLMQVFENKNATAVFCAEEVQDPTKYGVVVGEELENSTLLVKKVIEKPQVPPSKLAIVGVYMFSHEVFDAIERIQYDPSDEVQLTNAIQLLIESGRPVYAIKLLSGEERIDIGSPLSYFEALNRLFKLAAAKQPLK